MTGKQTGGTTCRRTPAGIGRANTWIRLRMWFRFHPSGNQITRRQKKTHKADGCVTKPGRFLTRKSGLRNSSRAQEFFHQTLKAASPPLAKDHFWRAESASVSSSVEIAFLRLRHSVPLGPRHIDTQFLSAFEFQSTLLRAKDLSFGFCQSSLLGMYMRSYSGS